MSSSLSLSSSTAPSESEIWTQISWRSLPCTNEWIALSLVSKSCTIASELILFMSYVMRSKSCCSVLKGSYVLAAALRELEARPIAYRWPMVTSCSFLSITCFYIVVVICFCSLNTALVNQLVRRSTAFPVFLSRNPMLSTIDSS